MADGQSLDGVQVGDYDLADARGAVQLMNASVVYLTMCLSDLVGVLSMSVPLVLRDSLGH